MNDQTTATSSTNVEMLSIKEACIRYQLSEVYVRRMILKQQLPTTKIEIGKNTFKHLISVNDLDAWRKAKSNRSRRSDNRAKFVLYATNDEFESLVKLMNEGNIEAEVKRANKVKES